MNKETEELFEKHKEFIQAGDGESDGYFVIPCDLAIVIIEKLEDKIKSLRKDIESLAEGIASLDNMSRGVEMDRT